MALWKAGKTTFLVHLVRALAEGGAYCGLPISKGQVLFVTEESEARWARRRDRHGLADHIDFLIRPFSSRPGPAAWHGFLGYLADLLGRKRYDLVVFDTLTSAWPVKDENDAANVQARSTPCTRCPAARRCCWSTTPARATATRRPPAAAAGR